MIPLLETPRLVLRRLSLADLDALCELEGDPRVMRYVGRGAPWTRQQVWARLARVIDRTRTGGGFGVWAAVEQGRGEFVGVFLLVPFAQTDEVEVGYRLLPAHWGRGYATEGTKALIGYGFERLGLERIIAIAYPQNKTSIRVMQKAGMCDEGTLHVASLGVDAAYYAIERESV